MRTKVIPAQITTVEDKIAGNLSFTQILILLSPVFLATIVYALFPPTMQIAVYKLVITGIVALMCMILSLRIDGIVVANWLVMVFRYNLRPKFYVFNKNDTYMRTLDLPKVVKKSAVITRVSESKEKTRHQAILPIPDVVKLEHLLDDKKLDLKFQVAKKGGLNVAFQEIAK